MSLSAYSSYKDSGLDWLGELPEHWAIRKFRYCFQESAEKIETAVVGEMLSVSGYRGIEIKEYDDDNRRRLEEDLVGYRIVRKGQLVVNTMWLNYAGLGVSEFEGHVSPAYRSYRVSRELNRRYVHHLMRSGLYVMGYTRLLTGIRPNSLQMSREDLMGFPVILPPIEEQAEIATFLDRETAKIDAFIDEQQRLVKLLKEKRQAVISHAVTKGLNHDAPTKDSGIEWLGEVPAHWTMNRLRSLFRQEKRQNQLGKPVLSVYRDYGVVLKESRDDNMNETPEDLSGYQLVNPSDVVVNKMKAWQGSLGVSDLEGITSPDYIVFTPRHQECSAFLHFLLRCQSMVSSYRGISNGIRPAQWRLEPDSFLNLRIFLPPVQEQSDLVSFIRGKTSHFETLIAEAVCAIDLLEERRNALISAAVTGKIDVRQAVAEVVA